GISELVIDVKSMNSSSLDVSATVDIDMNKSNWMTSSFNQTETLENKSSKIITYTLTVPGQIPSGNYTGKMTYSNSNNSVSSNMTFSVNASELWIMSNATEIPVTSPNTTYTLYANKDSGQKDYILEILNKNGGTLTDVNLNFSSLNFTKDNETITITLTNGTDDVIISGKNISFSNIPAETNKSIILKFNVSNHTDGTYSTTFSLTSSDGQPISNYSVNLQLVIDSTLDISMTHSSVAELYPGNTTTFEIDAKYRDGAPVTGLNSSNISALYLKNGASQEDIKLYLNNFTETITPGTYLLNLTLPLSMVGGNLQLGVTLSTGIYSGIYEEGIKVYGQYLSSPVWTSGKAPSNIDIRTFGSGYDTYGISITNNGFRSSGELTATLTTCSSSYLSIVGGQTKTIASIPAGSTGTASWSVDPSTNRSDGCAVTVTVTGGLFWFSQASSSVSKTIDITDTTPATETQDPSEDDEDTPTTLFSSPCDVTMCDYDEKCVNGVCTYFDCNDGYYSDHKCIKYTYAIDFISITENVEIVQGNSSSIRITFNNTGNQDIEDFNFTIEGLDNDSSYRVVTILEDEIVQMETQDIVVLLNISQDAPVGRQNITVWFNSEIHTDSTTFAISILPDEESIAEIDKWMPELERDIIVIKKLFDKRKDRINGTNFTLLNHTMFKIDLLLEEARSAKLAGDFMTVYEKKAQIEDLILQASDILDSGSAKTASIFSRYIIPIVVLIILSAAVYAFYSRIYAGKYSGLKQIQFNPLLMHSKKRGTKPAKYRSTRTADIKRYHHKPSFEIKLQHMLHALKHRINLKLEYMHTHQTKLTNKKFTSQYQFNIPEHIPKQQTKRYHHVKPEINHQNHHPKPKTQNDNPKQKIHDATNSYKRDNPKPSVTNVYKMIEQFEKSKTYCSKCGKNFKTKYELDLHKKYTHK
ncbi:MAG: hypothetical protein U9P44_01280, partial [archaeon]|nr:hypothetical protein [archaeon]